MSELKFEWTDKEDDELYKHGVTFIWVMGRTKAIQNFVEKLSYRIGHKCDFAFTAGRAHVDVLMPGYNSALEAVNDTEFMKQFIVPCCRESYDNETYFETI